MNAPQTIIQMLARKNAFHVTNSAEDVQVQVRITALFVKISKYMKAEVFQTPVHSHVHLLVLKNIHKEYFQTITLNPIVRFLPLSR